MDIWCIIWNLIFLLHQQPIPAINNCCIVQKTQPSPHLSLSLSLTVPIYPFLFKEIKPYLRKTNKTQRQSFHILQFRISASTSGMHKQFSANSIEQNINGKFPRYPLLSKGKKKFPRSPLQKLRNILWTLPRWYFSKQERIKEQNPTRSVGVLCCLLSLYILDRVVAVVSSNKAHCATELSYTSKELFDLEYIAELTGSIQMRREK